MTDRGQDALREHVLELLEGGHAHMGLEAATAEFPMDAINRRPPNVTYTPWHLLEHIRIAQRDILDFVREPDYESPEWPDGYWPERDAEATPEDWQATIDDIRADLDAIRDLVADASIDLTADLDHAPGYTLLREGLLVADHNAYHIGEFAILRQVMGTWPEDRS